MTSIQSTYTGAITGVRYTFGEQTDQSPHFGAFAVTDTTLPSQTGILRLEAFDPQTESNPILQQFGENCLSCHINAQPGEGEPFKRYTGCTSCHTPVRSLSSGDGENVIHTLNTAIPYTQCNTCHGTLDELPQTKTLTNPNDIAFRLAFLNPVVNLQLGDTILVTERGEPLWNTRLLPDGTYEMIGKVTRQRFTFRPVMGSGCLQDPARQESQYCHECHAVEH